MDLVASPLAPVIRWRHLWSDLRRLHLSPHVTFARECNMKFQNSLIGSLAVLSLVLSACGDDPEIVEVPGDPHAQIQSFTVTPDAIEAGTEVTAEWKTQDATGIELTRNGTAVDLGDASVAEGSIKLAVQESAVFVLKATGKTEFVDTRSASVTVKVEARPNIVAFTANPATVRAGETTTLEWQTKDTDTVRILDASGTALDLGDAVASEGSVTTAALAASTSFKLIAERAGQPASERTVSVTVTPLETTRILTFTAEPAEVEEGGASRLSWVTENAETVQLFAGTDEIDILGQGPAFGAVDVHPTVSGTYRLVASKGEQIDEKTVQVRVKGFPNASFEISPSPIDFGGTATATWSTEEAETVSIADAFGNPMEGGSVDASGTRVIHPSMTTTFTLTATGPTGKVARVTDVVEVRPAVLGFARVGTEPVGVGDVVELTWETGGATSVELSNLDGATKTIQGIQVDEGTATMPIGAGGTFEIVAKSGRLETRSQIQVILMLEPAIGTFGANRDVVSLVDGTAEVRLAWSGVNRADTLELDDSNLGRITLNPADLAAGFKVVTIEEDTTFTLTARNAAGFVSSTAIVRAVSMPTVSAVSVFPDYIGAGEEVELTWTTTGATNVEILANGLVVPGTHPASGTASIPVGVATTFEVKAFNDALDSASDIASVSVGAPQILTFTASETNAWTGTPIILSWTSRGAGTLRISQAGSVVHSTSTRADAISGSYTTPPLADGLHDFEVEIENAAGAVKNQSMRVRVGSGPSIDSFTVSPGQLLSGTDVTVSWSAGPDPDGNAPTLALTASLGGPYTIPATATGTATFTLTDLGAYAFTLTATTTAAGSVAATQQATTTVFGRPTVTLAATPSLFDDELHTDVELTWTSEHADTSLELFEIVSGTPTLIHQIPEATRGAGSFFAGPQTAARTFRIVATNGLGMTDEKDVIVGMQGPQITSFVGVPVEAYLNPATPPTVAVLGGDAVSLQWTTRKSTRVTLDFLTGMVLSESTEPFIDASTAGGTKLNLTQTCTTTWVPGDEGCGDLTFPNGFTFPFGGTGRTAMRIYTNGVASFDLTRTGSSFSNGTIVPTSNAWAHLPVFWDDLFFPTDMANGNVYYLEGTTTGGERYLVVQWKDATTSSTSVPPTESLNFEIVLYETGEFEYRYGGMVTATASRATGTEATIGYVVPGGAHYNLVSLDAAVSGGLANRSLRFSHPPSLGLNDSFTWTPTGGTGIVSRTATLIASAPGMPDATSTVTVEVHPKATVSISANLPAGQDAIRNTPFPVVWTTTNGNAFRVEDDTGATICTAAAGQVASGQCLVTSATTGQRTFTGVVTGGLGHEVSKTFDVIITSADFGINSFDVTSGEVDYGQPVTLMWDTGDADLLTITANGEPLVLPPTVDFNSDSFTIPALSEATEFELTITNVGTGATRSATRQVTVRTLQFSLTPSETEVSPGTPVDILITGTSLVPGEEVSFEVVPMTPATSLLEDISADPDATRIINSGASDDAAAIADFDVANTQFEFPYFGTVHSKVKVSVKGFILPETAALPSSPYSNVAIPTGTTSSFKNVLLAPFWGDLLTDATDAGVFTKFVSDPVDGDRFIIQWHKVNIWGSPQNTGTQLTFQVVLFKDGAFEFRYGDMNPTTNALAQGGAKTIGYQRPGGATGYQVHYGGGWTSSPTNTSITTLQGGASNRAFRWGPLGNNSTWTVTPSATGTYTVCSTLSGFSECKSVTIISEFLVSSFEASVSTIDFGESVELSWATKNADTFRLLEGTNPIADETTVDKDGDSIVVQPTATTTYTLEAKNTFLNKTITMTKTVTVKQFELGLTSNVATVNPGDPVTLSWTSTTFSGAPTHLVTPLADVSATSAYSDISGVAGVQEIIGTNKDSDIVLVTFDPGFVFPYFGTDHNAVRVSTDGYVSLDSAVTSTTSTNAAMPTTSSPKIHLAPFWDNLHTRTNGRVHAGQVGSEYVFQWSSMSMTTGSSATDEHNLNFQVVLRADGSFEYRYGLMAGRATTSSSCYPTPADCTNEANGSAATIGYQNFTGTAGFQLYFGGASPGSANFPFGDGLSNRAFAFTPHSGSGSITVNPYDTTSYKVCAISGTFLECTEPLSVKADWKIDSFNAAPSPVVAGTPLTLSWSTAGGDSVTVKAKAGTTESTIFTSTTDVASGTTVDFPTVATTYTLELHSKGRVKTMTKAVIMREVSVDFTVTSEVALPGVPVSLDWTITPNAAGTPTVSVPMVEVDASTGSGFEFQDISVETTKTQIIGSGLDSTVSNHTFPSGFSFPFMGTTYTSIRVGVDGYASFDTSTTGTGSNQIIPNTDSTYKRPNLAVFWDDLNTRTNGRVYAFRPDTDTYIIQWSRVSATNGSTATNEWDLNFQIVLHSDGRFEYRYGTMAGPATPATTTTACNPVSCENEAKGSSATIGYQDTTGTLGHQIHFGGNGRSHLNPIVSGGVAHRTFAFNPAATSPLVDAGEHSMTYYVCAKLGTYTECGKKTVYRYGEGTAVFSELMINPTGGATDQWFEVRNLLPTEIDMTGWTLSTGAGSYTITGPLVVPAKGHVVFSSAPMAGVTNVVYGASLPMNPAGDTLSLKIGTVPVSSVSWNSALQIPQGASLELDATRQFEGKGIFTKLSYYCVAEDLMGDGDAGTPGAESTCSSIPYTLDMNSTLPFIDIRASGTTVAAMAADSGRAGLALPFAMPIFHETYTNVWLDANGWMSFAAVQPSTSHFAPTLPRAVGATPEGPLVSAFWDDIGCTQGNGLPWDFQYQAKTVSGHEVMILQWNNYARCSSAGGATFQVQLWENGDIAMAYLSMDAVPGSSAWNVYNGSGAWIGLEGLDGTLDTVTALYKTVEPLSGRTILFKRK